LIGQPPLAEHKNYDMTTVIGEKKVEKKIFKKVKYGTSWDSGNILKSRRGDQMENQTLTVGTFYSQV
jgi:hypothetical protein